MSLLNKRNLIVTSCIVDTNLFAKRSSDNDVIIDGESGYYAAVVAFPKFDRR
jgi:hypothetical protein